MTDHAIRFFTSAEDIRRTGEAMIACTLPKGEWTHEAHLATCAWLVLERPDVSPERDLPVLIRRYNESVGGVNDDTQGYHETITQVSIRGVRRALAGVEGGSLLTRINRVLAAPEGRRDWVRHFYSAENLFSVAARRQFVEPDLHPLPEAATQGASISRPARSGPESTPPEEAHMADLSKIKEHQEVIGADGVHVGRVDEVEGDRIKLVKADSGEGSHKGHHHYISGGLVASVDGDKVRLSANADNAVLLEEEEGGEGLGEGGSTLKKVAIGAAAVAGVAAVGAVVYKAVKGKGDKDDSGDKAGA